LPDDSVAPKADLLEGIENIKETQMQIAQIHAQAQIMQQKAQQFLMEDPDGQASQMADAMAQMQEQQFANQEAALDAQVADEEQALPEVE
jgi:putative heme iron utilization protein